MTAEHCGLGNLVRESRMARPFDIRIWLEIFCSANRIFHPTCIHELLLRGNIERNAHCAATITNFSKYWTSNFIAGQASMGEERRENANIWERNKKRGGERTKLAEIEWGQSKIQWFISHDLRKDIRFWRDLCNSPETKRKNNHKSSQIEMNIKVFLYSKTFFKIRLYELNFDRTQYSKSPQQLWCPKIHIAYSENSPTPQRLTALNHKQHSFTLKTAETRLYNVKLKANSRENPSSSSSSSSNQSVSALRQN